jgi:predicted metal-dependent hydrolase
VMPREQGLQLAPKIDIDPTQQDRRHSKSVARPDTHTQALARVGRVEGSSPFRKGLELIRAGEYFAAHEELENAWRAAPPAERDFFQGLVHVAVAWYQAGRGRRIGTERQLAKAIRRLQPFEPTYRGVDVSRLLAQLRELSARGSLDLPPPDLRWSVLEAAEPDSVQDSVQRDTKPPVAVKEQQQAESD